MSNHSVTTKTVQVPNGSLEIDSYLAQPEIAGEYPGIIVIQEIFGVNEHIQDVTRRVASLGYVAIAPAIFQRVAPGFTAGYDQEGVTLGRQYKVLTKAEELRSDIEACIAYLYQLPNVKKTGVGTIGFCFGGHIAYLTATIPEIKAIASFYGAGIANWCPGEETFTIDRTADIKGTIYTFFGMHDPSIPHTEIDAIEAALTSHHISHKVFRYEGAEHGFFCDRRSNYNAEAAADAWQKVQGLFHNLAI